MQILVLHGPNLNLFGRREPHIYGTTTLAEINTRLSTLAGELGVELKVLQSNHEGALIDKIHETGFSYDGIVLNAGAYTHTSVAIADAIRAVTTPVVEVHISNIHKREAFRHHSFLSEACKGCIVGFGLDSYRLAIESFVNI